MAQKKKTLVIRDLIEEVNRRNRESTCEPAVRMGWNMLLEGVMIGAEVYSGFSYLTADQVPTGCLPGVIPDPKGTDHKFPDESRRQYYTHTYLRG